MNRNGDDAPARAPKKFLIVNADDLGLSEGVNRGVNVAFLLQRSTQGVMAFGKIGFGRDRATKGMDCFVQLALLHQRDAKRVVGFVQRRLQLDAAP